MPIPHVWPTVPVSTDAAAAASLLRGGTATPTDGPTALAPVPVAAASVAAGPTSPVRTALIAPVAAAPAAEVAAPEAPLRASAPAGAPVAMVPVSAVPVSLAAGPTTPPVATASTSTAPSTAAPRTRPSPGAGVRVGGVPVFAEHALPTGTVPDVAAAAAAAAAATAGSAFTARQKGLSLIFRAVSRVGPAVNDKDVAVPVLMVIWFVSHMTFLAGPLAGGTEKALHLELSDLFKDSPMDGWLWLCRAYGLCSHGLFLLARVMFEHQLGGQPPSIPDWLLERLNPTKSHQWLSRRLVMRLFLDLWVTDGLPGCLSVAELASLRSNLGTENGRAAARAARCTIVEGLSPSGHYTTMARLEFDWNFPWKTDGATVALVSSLTPGFLKVPHGALTTVKTWPVSAETTVAKKVAGRKRGLPGRSPGGPPSRKVPARGAAAVASPSSAPAKRKTKPAGSAAVDAATSFVPALVDIPGCSTATIESCAAWPRGAWAAQVPLAAHLDHSLAGWVQLKIRLKLQPPPPQPRAMSTLPESAAMHGGVAHGRSGRYLYHLTVVQMRTVITPETSALGTRIRAASGLLSSCQSSTFLAGVCSVAADVIGERAQVRRDRGSLATAASPVSPLTSQERFSGPASSAVDAGAEGMTGSAIYSGAPSTLTAPSPTALDGSTATAAVVGTRPDTSAGSSIPAAAAAAVASSTVTSTFVVGASITPSALSVRPAVAVAHVPGSPPTATLGAPAAAAGADASTAVAASTVAAAADGATTASPAVGASTTAAASVDDSRSPAVLNRAGSAAVATIGASVATVALRGLEPNSSDVRMTVDYALPPPAEKYSFCHSFFSDMRLPRIPQHKRDAGRLCVVAGAEEDPSDDDDEHLA